MCLSAVHEDSVAGIYICTLLTPHNYDVVQSEPSSDYLSLHEYDVACGMSQ